MKIEMHIEGPNVSAWFAAALPGYTAAKKADADAEEAEWQKAIAANKAQMAEAEPTAEAEKPKRAPRKAKEEPAAQITTNPEDRKPVDEVIEDAVIVEETPAPAAKPKTRDDLKEAMSRYQAQMGMEATMANMPGLLGAPKQSLVPEDPAVFASIIDRINAALEADPNG